MEHAEDADDVPLSDINDQSVDNDGSVNTEQSLADQELVIEILDVKPH